MARALGRHAGRHPARGPRRRGPRPARGGAHDRRDLTPHGFAPDPQLDADPPAEALAWCADAGRGTVVAVQRLRGGTSSAVHAVDVRRADGSVAALVLRRDVGRLDPGELDREPANLARAADAAVPTPEFVAAAPGLVLMTRLPGAVSWRPDLARLRAAMTAIHALPAPDGPVYAPYGLHLVAPPAWSQRPEVWERALELFHGPPPAVAPTLIHRDFHPGNVVWQAGELTGVVDWLSACAGPPAADAGHCRWNLATEWSQAAADAFATVAPYWDVVAALGGNAAADFDERDEAFLAAAVSRPRRA